MPYVPRTLDTSGIALPPPLEGITERLAEQVHDVWALRRLRAGWTHGPRRDDARLVHPGLVPYGELPESEKDYDRATALAVVHMLLALGYRVVPPAAPGMEDAGGDPTPGG